MVCRHHAGSDPRSFHVGASGLEGQGAFGGGAGCAQSQGRQSLLRGGDLTLGTGIHPADPPQYDHLPRHPLRSSFDVTGALTAVSASSREIDAIAGDRTAAKGVRPIRGLRWWICAMLFASTAINYIDRQTLSLLAPYLKLQYGWSNSDYADIVIAFRIAYSVGQTFFGWLMDRIGTRRGLTLSVAWYSVVSAATSLANGFFGFALCRFCLGAGESANWPAASKAVSEWFPKRERSLATAFFDSGSSIGGAVAPFIVLFIYFHWGARPAFMLPALLGAIWLLVWRRLYHRPADHPRITEDELRLIEADRDRGGAAGALPRPRWSQLLTLRATWGTICARTFTDPVWF